MWHDPTVSTVATETEPRGCHTLEFAHQTENECDFAACDRGAEGRRGSKRRVHHL